MQAVGTVESLWRYPVKSMRGEELAQAFVGFSGVYGDRFYAFLSSAAPKRFPYFTGREKDTMILYRPSYRNGNAMLQPSNLAEAQTGSGLTSLYPDPAAFMVDVETPSGDILAIDDPELLRRLREGVRDRHELTLIRSHRSITDSRPVSLFSLQTVRQLSQELGAGLDKRRFRANLYLNLHNSDGFAEEEFVGRTLQIGPKSILAVVGRDQRCKMITLDPDTGEANPELTRLLARAHGGNAGVYAAVLVEGIVSPGDKITVLN